MSDAMRSYSPSRRVSHGVPTSRGGILRWFLLLLLIAGAVWIYWSTRDTWPMERLVPRDQTFHLRAEHVLESRQKVADSPMWSVELLPEQYAAVPGWLRSNFGLPDWVLNNLVSDVCYVSGKDLDGFSDLLVVTRMSRIGCLLERYHGFVDGIEDEYAGGLHLRKVMDIDSYYAVRGRTLVFSPSRAALVEALTLRAPDAVETLEETIPVAGGDIQGRVTFTEDDPLGRYVGETEFGLSFEPDSIHFSSQSVVHPAWQEELSNLASAGASQEISVPSQGGVVLAGDLGTPLPAVWSAVDALSGNALSSYVKAWLAAGAAGAQEEESLDVLDALQKGLGSAFSLHWSAFDVNGMVPLPELQLYLETQSGLTATLLDGVPELELGADPADWQPYREPETGIVRYPIGWGSIVEPAFYPVENGLRFALHPEHLRAASAENADSESTAIQGQLYLRIRTAEVVELLRDGGELYADAGLIRGHTRESLGTALTQALHGTREIDEISATAEYNAGAVRLDIVVELLPEGPDPDQGTE